MPKKKENLFSEELAQSGTVQGLVSWGSRRYQCQMQIMLKVFKLWNIAADALKSHEQEIKNL